MIMRTVTHPLHFDLSIVNFSNSVVSFYATFSAGIGFSAARPENPAIDTPFICLPQANSDDFLTNP
jgi:hypothetical protein